MVKKIFRLPYFPVLLAPFVLYAGHIFGGKALFWGTPSLQFIPWWDWAWEIIRQGGIPLWNPWVGMGAPLAANYQSAIFYPPHWIYFLLSTWGGVSLMAWGTSLLVPIHLAWAGLGMVKFVDKLGGNRLAQTVSGLSFSLSGYLASRAGFLSINASVSWLPWIMLFSYSLAKEGKVKNLAKLGIVFGFQFLAGHAQTSWYSIIMAGAWTLFLSFVFNGYQERGKQIREHFKVVGRFFAAGIAGALLAAVQLVPTWEYLRQSQRAVSVPFETAMTYSFWPWRLLTLLHPDVFGSPVRGTYWGYGNYWEDAVYLGLFPFVLALISVTAAVRARMRDQSKVNGEIDQFRLRTIFFFSVMVLISFLLAVGDHLPFFPFLYRNIPTFKLFQAPTRISLWAVYSLAVLAGFGIQLLDKPKGRQLYWNRLAVAGSAAVAVGAGITWYLSREVELTFVKSAALLGFWAVGSSLLILFNPGRREKKGRAQWMWLVGLFIAADLIFAGWGLNPGVDADFYQAGSEKGSIKERIYLQADDEYRLKFERFFRFDDFQMDNEWRELFISFLPNLNMLNRIESANNFDPLVPARYQTWMETLEAGDSFVQESMLQIMAVNTIARVDQNLEVNFQQVSGDRDKVYFSSCPRFVESEEEALRLISEAKVELEREIILESEGSDAFDVICSSPKAVLEILKKGHSGFVISVTTDQDGWLFLSEVYYPGWKAWVDGNRVQVHRGNYLFQAVPVSAGSHLVKINYQPQTFWLGGGISLAAVAGLIILLRLNPQRAKKQKF